MRNGRLCDLREIHALRSSGDALPEDACLDLQKVCELPLHNAEHEGLSRATTVGVRAVSCPRLILEQVLGSVPLPSVCGPQIDGRATANSHRRPPTYKCGAAIDRLSAHCLSYKCKEVDLHAILRLKMSSNAP